MDDPVGEARSDDRGPRRDDRNSRPAPKAMQAAQQKAPFNSAMADALKGLKRG
jgi:uncharacterized protein